VKTEDKSKLSQSCLVAHLRYVAQPFGDVIECLATGNIIDKHDSHGATVVGRCYCMEAFLASSVPAKPNHEQVNSTDQFFLAQHFLFCLVLSFRDE